MSNVTGVVVNVVVILSHYRDLKKTLPAAARCLFQDQGQRHSTAASIEASTTTAVVKVKLADMWRRERDGGG